MSPFRAAATAVSAESSALDAEIASVVCSLCDRYGIDSGRVYVTEMGGFRGGLGNAIPIPVPFRRIYLVRYHRCIREADPLALRGLFAHELMHVLQYSRARYSDLSRFIVRYGAFSATAALKTSFYFDWVRQLEHLTDLMAVKFGEGESIAAWKRFKADATTRGIIRDSWDHLYLRDAEIDSLAADEVNLGLRIGRCVAVLRAKDSLRPFASETS